MKIKKNFVLIFNCLFNYNDKIIENIKSIPILFQMWMIIFNINF